MTKIVKGISLLLAVSALLCLLCACGDSGAKDDIPVADIVTAVDAALANDALVPVDEAYVQGRLKVDTSVCTEYAVKLNSVSTTIDEYGVFKAKDADMAKAVAEDVQAYLDERLATWMEEYLPEEKPKVESAEVRTEGVYVMYAILSDADKSAAFGALEDTVK